MTSDRPEIKYRPCQCAFLRKEVWAILTRQSQGTWHIVNCLDKDAACYAQACVFTTDGGEWPFERPAGGGCREAECREEGGYGTGA